MIVRGILIFVFLLAAWAQVAGACTDVRASPAQAQNTMAAAVQAVAEDPSAIGGEHRCECPAVVQNALSTASDSKKFLLAANVEGAGALPATSNPHSLALAVHARASSFVARHSAQPPYLLLLRLRQ